MSCVPDTTMAHKRCLFHLSPVRLSDTDRDDHRVVYGVFQKEVDSSEALVRRKGKDKGELVEKFSDRYAALDKIQELAKPYGEFAIFE